MQVLRSAVKLHCKPNRRHLSQGRLPRPPTGQGEERVHLSALRPEVVELAVSNKRHLSRATGRRELRTALTVVVAGEVPIP